VRSWGEAAHTVLRIGGVATRGAGIKHSAHGSRVWLKTGHRAADTGGVGCDLWTEPMCTAVRR
jgi:hypothetical protein